MEHQLDLMLILLVHGGVHLPCIASVGCCGGGSSSSLPEEMTISAFVEEPPADEDDDPRV